jgi:putative copper resistance protein D
MLSFVWITLRFVHFTALMLTFGSALYGAWLAPTPFRRLMARRYLRLQQYAAAWSFLSAGLMLAIQGGLMGSGWPDVLSAPVWYAVLQTRFGTVWLWQIILAAITLVVALMVPRSLPRQLLILSSAQFILLAGVGHATLHVGVTGAAQQINQALHLIFAAGWVGGLLPVIYCMRMAQRRWRQQAIATMMRFSRYGHLAVAGVLLTGIANVLFIRGVVSFWLLPWGQWLLLKFVLVMVMVVVALVNRYVLVPRMRQRSPRVSVWFIWMTKFELGTGAVVLAVVSLFATLEPF